MRQDDCRVATGTVDLTDMTGIDSQIAHLHRVLDTNSARHRVASQNIANVNTPGYQAEEVVPFEDALNQASPLSKRIYSVKKKDGQARLDGNTVDIDKELGQLKKSALHHRVFTQLLATKLRQLKNAMSDQ